MAWLECVKQAELDVLPPRAIGRTASIDQGWCSMAEEAPPSDGSAQTSNPGSPTAGASQAAAVDAFAASGGAGAATMDQSAIDELLKAASFDDPSAASAEAVQDSAD